MGHAATYVTFDVARAGAARRRARGRLRPERHRRRRPAARAGRARRRATGRTWPPREIALFREDMTALAVIPPDHYVGVVESIDPVARGGARSCSSEGAAYRGRHRRSPTGDDVYLDLSQRPRVRLGLQLDPRADAGGLRRPRRRPRPRRASATPLDPLLWRAARDGRAVLGRRRARRPAAPAGTSSAPPSRWTTSGMAFDVQGGGTDLVFPHHEMSAAQAVGPDRRAALRPRLRAPGDGRARRREDEQVQGQPRPRLAPARRRGRPDGHPAGAAGPALPHRRGTGPTSLLAEAAEAAGDLARGAVGQRRARAPRRRSQRVRERVADDLDTPGALAAVDRWAHECLTRGGEDPAAPGLVGRLLDALLGVRL